MRLLKKLLALSLVGTMLLSGCSSKTSSDSGSGSSQDAVAATKDGVERKELDLTYTSEIFTLNYLDTTSSTVTDMTALVLDGLVQFNLYDELVPNMAESWECSDDGLVWTFHLRDGLHWYNNKGEVVADVTAKDYVDAMTYLLDPEVAAANSGTASEVIKNADAYLKGEITDFEEVGIKAIDDKTVEYTLEIPVSYFASLLEGNAFLPIYMPFMEEMGDSFGTSAETILSSGAYFFTSFDPQNKHVYTYNPKYWDVENIYLSKITKTYNSQADIGTTLFERGETAVASISDDIIDEWMTDPERSQYVTKGEQKTNTYTFKLNYLVPNVDAEFAPEDWQKAAWNLNFRQSLAYGIDKLALATVINPYIAESIVNNTLTPAGYIFNSKGIDYTDLEPLASLPKTTYEPDLAKSHRDLAIEELGDEVTFPIKMVCTYTSTSTSTANMMQVLEQQLESLLGPEYIDVVINPTYQTFAEIRSDGNYSFVFNGFTGGYRDPLTYATLYYSQNSIAANRGSLWVIEEYLNEDGLSRYDELVEIANAERLDNDLRYELFAEAEQFLIENALVIPFYERPYNFQLTKIQPFYAYHQENGVATLKGARLLDDTLTVEQYNQFETQIQEEKLAR